MGTPNVKKIEALFRGILKDATPANSCAGVTAEPTKFAVLTFIWSTLAGASDLTSNLYMMFPAFPGTLAPGQIYFIGSPTASYDPSNDTLTVTIGYTPISLDYFEF